VEEQPRVDGHPREADQLMLLNVYLLYLCIEAYCTFVCATSILCTTSTLGNICVEILLLSTLFAALVSVCLHTMLKYFILLPVMFNRFVECSIERSLGVYGARAVLSAVSLRLRAWAAQCIGLPASRAKDFTAISSWLALSISHSSDPYYPYRWVIAWCTCGLAGAKAGKRAPLWLAAPSSACARIRLHPLRMITSTASRRNYEDSIAYCRWQYCAAFRKCWSAQYHIL
jgi:hypothetical protein